MATNHETQYAPFAIGSVARERVFRCPEVELSLKDMSGFVLNCRYKREL